ncbi:unnamed protein product [Thlaspi arvense]|uniref:Uncharacterized protein n=1 Tax=Thlaspi arvense TaxID=13288 RepID=A0AAU9SFQ6_THLAR|nr:unnamed protein product [Thlaspi arvense]
MEEHCLVLYGEWSCGGNGKWDFVIDNNRMSRVLQIEEGMTVAELKKKVIEEFFGGSSAGISVSLSYWPPNTTELATGITTLPVLVEDIGRSRVMETIRGYITLSFSSKRLGASASSTAIGTCNFDFNDEELLNVVDEAEGNFQRSSGRKEVESPAEESDSDVCCAEVGDAMERMLCILVEKVSMLRLWSLGLGATSSEWVVDEANRVDNAPLDSETAARISVQKSVDTYPKLGNVDSSGRSAGGHDVEVPAAVTEMVLLPPRTRRPSGRRKEGKIPTVGEIPGTRSKKKEPNKCSRCTQPGHNRTSCTNLI